MSKMSKKKSTLTLAGVQAEGKLEPKPKPESKSEPKSKPNPIADAAPLFEQVIYIWDGVVCLPHYYQEGRYVVPFPSIPGKNRSTFSGFFLESRGAKKSTAMLWKRSLVF